MNAAAPPIPIALCPDVLVFPDIQDAKRFYAFAAHPRVSRDETGAPLISLIIYGKTTASQFVASGGQFTATFDLAISHAERAVIERQLQGSVLYPDWIDTEVTVKLIDSITGKGNASLAGPNECVVSAMLSGPQADSLRDAWLKRTSGLHVQYVVGMRGAAQSAATSDASRNYAAGASTQSYSSRVSLSVTHAGRVQMTVEGAIQPGLLDLSGRIQTISL
ncbi:MAG: hypothetical protein IT168_19695 [Bryobacterales bacterium]|nr:hypothetical protein [Bryobacterales bacterium]